ncbi:MAG TPA: BON domain-containing protein [Burkholderiales bacterium]|nr:BON domain-containing protein [Burkholderiales bacterium]
MNRSQTFLFGVTLGAGLAYFLDRDKGARRQALVKDRLTHVGHEVQDATRSTVRHVRNRATGLAHEAGARVMERGGVDDRVLEERVRSAIGRRISNPGRIDVTADDGRITLTGDAPSGEVQTLVRTVKAVRGVEGVTNSLDLRRGEA